jgi:hypothetical protein
MNWKQKIILNKTLKNSLINSKAKHTLTTTARKNVIGVQTPS